MALKTEMKEAIGLNLSVLFHILVILAFTFASKLLYVGFGVLLVYSIATKFRLFRETTNIEKTIWISYFAVTAGMMVVNFFMQPIVAFHFIMTNITFLGAIIFSRNAELYYRSSRISLIAFQVFVICAILVIGFDNYPVDLPLEKLVEGASANGITSYLIVLQVNFCIISFMVRRKVPYLTIILTILIALTAYGRGSILSGLAILVVSIFVQAMHRGGKSLLIVSAVFFAVVALGFTLYYDEIYFLIAANTKLTAGLYDEARMRVLSDYMGKIDAATIFTGASYTNTVIEEYLHGNPHNSLVRAHHVFGLPYLLLVVALPFISVFRRRYLVEWVYFTFMFLIFFFRIFSEPIVFPTILDFYVFSLFLILNRSREVNPLPVANNNFRVAES